MAFPSSPSVGDEYTAPSGAVYKWTSYGAWRVSEPQTDFSVLTSDDRDDLLAQIVQVDGAGSGLDADLLDGQSGSYYADIATRLGYTPFNAAHIPTGTKMPFFQANVPAGWTLDNTHNDKALRVVSGTGGGSGGSTDFTSVFGARTIARANLPNVTLSASGTTSSDGAHSHTYTKPSPNGAQNGNTTSISSLLTSSDSTSTDGAHTHTVSATTESINGGVSQTTMDFAVKYIDVIIGTKS